MTVIVKPSTPVRDNPDFALEEVIVRLARPDEHREWDGLMNELHYLGFRQFAGRGLRYIAEWRGQWVALLGWQTGVFQCAPRDEWLGWHRAVQMRRLHLIANNTRFLILPAGTDVPNLGSCVLGANLQRLSADWQAAWGHPVLLAETFVEMRVYKGTVYRAANWIAVGLTKGYARSNGKYTDKHGVKKKMLVYPLQADARALLRDPEDREEWGCRDVDVRYGQGELRSLRSLLDEVGDHRKARGLRHPLGAVLALLLLAKLAGKTGGRQAEAFCKALPQRELRALGCRFERYKRRYTVPSDTTFQRVLAETDAGALEDVLRRWTQPRCGRVKALAGDGKRLRGANKEAPEGVYYETVTLVDHASGMPVATRGYQEKGGEPWAMRELLEEVPLAGVIVTLDTGHAGYDTERALVEQHGAQYLINVKGNCPKTHETLQGIDWQGARRASHTWERGHGRWSWRKVEVVELEPGQINFEHAKQALRITHRTKETADGKVEEEILYAITSLGRDEAGARRLLTLHRRHWMVENANHHSRDVTFREDASRMRTGRAPLNNAALTNLVLAIVRRRGQFRAVPPVLTYFGVRREKAIEVIEGTD